MGNTEKGEITITYPDGSTDEFSATQTFAGGGGLDPEDIPAGDILQNAILGLNADGEAVKGDLFGKYVRVLKASDIDENHLTDDQIEAFSNGVFVEGTLLNVYNPILCAASYQATPQGKFYGMLIGGSTGTTGIIRLYVLNKNNKTISLATYDGPYFSMTENKLILQTNGNPAWAGRIELDQAQGVSISSAPNAHVSLEEKIYPKYPSEQTGNLFNFVLDNGTLKWTPGLNQAAMTQAEFDQLANPDDNTLYFIPEEA